MYIEDTVTDLATRLPELLVAPPLYQAPPTWQAWVAAATETEVLGAETVSGRIVEAGGPAWMYGLWLPRILSGELLGDPELGPDAEVTLASFEAGRPLYIGVWGSIERFSTFDPTLTCLGPHRYAVGSRPAQQFTAPDHVTALEKAGAWFLRARECEIAERKTLAQNLRLSPLAVDILEGALRRLPPGQRALYDMAGEPIAWENLAHGRYGVYAGDWCYLFHGSATTAVRLGYLALAEARQTGRDRQWNAQPVVHQVPHVLNLVPWDEDTLTYHQDHGSVWQAVPHDGERWSVAHNGRPVLTVTVDIEAGITLHLVRRGRQETVPVPPGWSLSDGDLTAWSVCRAVRDSLSG